MLLLIILILVLGKCEGNKIGSFKTFLFILMHKYIIQPYRKCLNIGTLYVEINKVINSLVILITSGVFTGGGGGGV